MLLFTPALQGEAQQFSVQRSSKQLLTAPSESFGIVAVERNPHRSIERGRDVARLNPNAVHISRDGRSFMDDPIVEDKESVEMRENQFRRAIRHVHGCYSSEHRPASERSPRLKIFCSANA
jgi:hypothetical protein